MCRVCRLPKPTIRPSLTFHVQPQTPPHIIAHVFPRPNRTHIWRENNNHIPSNPEPPLPHMNKHGLHCTIYLCCGHRPHCIGSHTCRGLPIVTCVCCRNTHAPSHARTNITHCTTMPSKKNAMPSIITFARHANKPFTRNHEVPNLDQYVWAVYVGCRNQPTIPHFSCETTNAATHGTAHMFPTPKPHTSGDKNNLHTQHTFQNHLFNT